MSEYTPITGELRDAMCQWGWVESDGSITFTSSSMPPSIDAEQSLAISGSDFDRMCDAIDGVFYRVQRGGRWCSVCYSDMTPDERMEVIYDRMRERPLDERVGYYRRLAELMADQLYDMGEQLGVMCE